MIQIKTFHDLLVWQKAHEFTLVCYQTTKQYPNSELYGIISQTRRAAVSISANIVEGFKRQSVKDALRFYTIAYSSLEEVKYLLLLAKDLNYLSEKIYNHSLELSEEVSKLLFRWTQSQKNRLH